MTPERWQRIQELFEATVRLAPDGRKAFLVSACGSDEELRDEVESLLIHSDMADSFIKNPTLNIAWEMLRSERPDLAGQTMGPYRVVGRIGSGGMGDVYRAEDTRLHRTVAIKVLAVTNDDASKRRFEREAQAIAALNHPHICTVYDVGHHGKVDYIVMEYLEGETLADRLEKGVLLLDQAMKYGVEVLEALDAAHRHGVVHRDLKPANIMITKNGVKLLDFGIAQWRHASRSTLTDQEPDASTRLTAEGTIVGTPQYMAPEQLHGKRSDERTDIFAFGAVLYEMVTGKKAFHGDTTAGLIASILEQKPGSVVELRPSVPRGLDRLIQTCLAKDPGERWQTARDLKRELAALTAEPTTNAVVVNSDRRSRRTAGILAAAVLLCLVTGALIFWVRLPSAVTLPVVRSVIALPPGQELDRQRSGAYSVAISPDGMRIVYIALSKGRYGLWVRDLDASDGRLLPGTDDAEQPFFSPDGKWVAYFARGALYKVGLTGEVPVRICAVPRPPRGGSWRVDDTIVFGMLDRLPLGAPLSIVSAKGSMVRNVPNSEGAIYPDLLPDGDTVLFTVREEGAIITMSLDGSAKKVVARTAESPLDGPAILGEGELIQARYVPPGHLVYGQAFRVMAAPFDPASLMLTGSSTSMVENVFRATGDGAVQFAVSATGTLVYAPEGRHYQLTWVDSEGRATPINVAPDAFRFPRLSRDATRLAVTIDSPDRRSDIWIYDLERGTRSRLTSDRHRVMPVWTPDGARVVFTGDDGVMWRLADGSGQTESLLPGPERFATSWSPDGRTLLLNATDSPSPDLWALSREDGSARPLLNGASAEWFGQFSPDGRFIAYMSTESGDRSQIYVVSYPDLRGKVAVSRDGGVFPMWSRDGRELFFRQGNDAVVAVPIDVSRGFRAGKPQVLFSGPYVAAGGDRTFDVAPDGRFLMIRSDEAASGRQLNLVTNWFQELERLVPRQ